MLSHTEKVILKASRIILRETKEEEALFEDIMKKAGYSLQDVFSGCEKLQYEGYGKLWEGFHHQIIGIHLFGRGTHKLENMAFLAAQYLKEQLIGIAALVVAIISLIVTLFHK